MERSYNLQSEDEEEIDEFLPKQPETFDKAAVKAPHMTAVAPPTVTVAEGKSEGGLLSSISAALGSLFSHSANDEESKKAYQTKTKEKQRDRAEAKNVTARMNLHVSALPESRINRLKARERGNSPIEKRPSKIKRTERKQKPEKVVAADGPQTIVTGQVPSMNRPLNAKTNMQLISLQKARVALANVRQNRNRNSHGKDNGASVRTIRTYRLNRLQIQQ